MVHCAVGAAVLMIAFVATLSRFVPGFSAHNDNGLISVLVLATVGTLLIIEGVARKFGFTVGFAFLSFGVVAAVLGLAFYCYLTPEDRFGDRIGTSIFLMECGGVIGAIGLVMIAWERRGLTAASGKPSLGSIPGLFLLVLGIPWLVMGVNALFADLKLPNEPIHHDIGHIVYAVMSPAALTFIGMVMFLDPPRLAVTRVRVSSNFESNTGRRRRIESVMKSRLTKTRANESNTRGESALNKVGLRRSQ